MVPMAYKFPIPLPWPAIVGPLGAAGFDCRRPPSWQGRLSRHPRSASARLSRGHAPPWRELQRRDLEAGEGLTGQAWESFVDGFGPPQFCQLPGERNSCALLTGARIAPPRFGRAADPAQFCPFWAGLLLPRGPARPTKNGPEASWLGPYHESLSRLERGAVRGRRSMVRRA
jgi:hypothetical protein